MKTAAKDFKMTELGPIPKDWEVKRLGDCCSITTGHKDVNEGCENGQFPFFTCSRDVYRANCYSFDGEAILVAGNGDVGNLHYCNGKFEAYQRTYVLMNFKIDTQYLWCELGANLMERLTDGKIGTSIPYIVLGQLQDYMFALPPLPEQRKIAAALSDVDEMIAALEKLIEKKRKIKTGAMQRLLTGKTRLPGFKGAWVEKRLGECADIRTGKRNGDDQTPSGMYPFFVRSQVVYRIDSYSFDGEAILVPGEGGIGSIFHYINGKFDYHQRVYKISDFTGGVYGKFLFHYLKRYFGEWALSQTVKATVDSLRLPTFENFIMIVPPTLAEQKAIAKVLGDMDEEIAALEAELAKTRQLKQGMMQELLTGKVRLV